MKIITVIARFLLGFIFLVFGLNGFLHFIPSSPPSPVVFGNSVFRRRGCSNKVTESFSETIKEELMLKIAIIIGSTRPNRNGEAVAKWVYQVAKKRSDAEFELVDIKDFNLPLLDEPMPPIMGQYSKPHTKTWAAKIGSFDGYVFVTPEYNHGISGALKNAIDFLFRELHDNAAGFVCYGGAGAALAV